jgi:hypothetical protein
VSDEASNCQCSLQRRARASSHRDWALPYNSFRWTSQSSRSTTTSGSQRRSSLPRSTTISQEARVGNGRCERISRPSAAGSYVHSPCWRGGKRHLKRPPRHPCLVPRPRCPVGVPAYGRSRRRRCNGARVRACGNDHGAVRDGLPSPRRCGEGDRRSEMVPAVRVQRSRISKEMLRRAYELGSGPSCSRSTCR